MDTNGHAPAGVYSRSGCGVVVEDAVSIRSTCGGFADAR